MSNEQTPVVDPKTLERLIAREQAQIREEEKKAFLESELQPEKFGPAQETAKYLKTSGMMEEILKRSPELELLAVGTTKDAVRLRDAILKRGEELAAIKEQSAEAARLKAEAEKAKGVQPAGQPADSPLRPVNTTTPTEEKHLYATDKEFTKKLAEAGVSKGMIDLAALTGRDY